MANTVSDEKIEGMYRTYMKKSSISHVSRECGVSRPTVKRYIEEGDKKRGVESFKARKARESSEEKAQRPIRPPENSQLPPETLQKPPENSQKKRDDEEEKHRRESMALVRKFKGMMAKALNTMEEIDLSQLSPLKISVILEAIPKIEKFLHDSNKQTSEEATLKKNTLPVSPDTASEIARLILSDRVVYCDAQAIAKRQRELNHAALEKHRPQDMVEVIEAEFTTWEDPFGRVATPVGSEPNKEEE